VLCGAGACEASCGLEWTDGRDHGLDQICLCDRFSERARLSHRCMVAAWLAVVAASLAGAQPICLRASYIRALRQAERARLSVRPTKASELCATDGRLSE